MQHSLERHNNQKDGKIFTSGTNQLSSSLFSFERVKLYSTYRVLCGMKNILGSRKTHLSTSALISNLSCCDADVWQEVCFFWGAGDFFFWGTGSSAWLEHKAPNFLAFPLPPLMRKFMSVIKTLAVAIRLVPQAANHGVGEWRVVPTRDISTHMLACFKIVPYSISTMGVCGTYTFTAGVLQSSGQDLGCSSSQCFSLPLGTEHVELPLFFLSQRVAVAHLEGPRRAGLAERTNQGMCTFKCLFRPKFYCSTLI